MQGLLYASYFFFILVLRTATAQKSYSACYEHKCFHLYTSETTFARAQLNCKSTLNGTLFETFEEDLWKNITTDILGLSTDANRYTGGVSLGLQLPAYTTTPKTSNNKTIVLQKNTYWTRTISSNSNQQCLYGFPPSWTWSFHSYCSDYYFAYLCERQANSCDIKKLNISNAEFDHCLTNNIFVSHEYELHIKCWDGYQRVSNEPIICFGGNWTGPIPPCLPGCAAPTSRKNSKPVLNHEKTFYSVGENVTYICDEDYITWDDDVKTHFTLYCNNKGKWSEPEKHCIIREKREKKILFAKGYLAEQISMPCGIAENLTRDEFYWLKDDERLTLNGKHSVDPDGTLVIKNPRDTDKGIFYCVSVNRQSIAVDNIFYELVPKVNCSDYTNDFFIENHYLDEGDSKILGCRENSEDSHQVHWYKDGITLSENKDRNILPSGSLLLKNVQLDSIGLYSCSIIQKNLKSCVKNVTHKVTVAAHSGTVCGKRDTKLAKDTPHEPWIVTFWEMDDVVPFCYGSVINRKWVITTGHCLKKYRRRKVIKGLMVELGRGTKDRKKISIASVKVHPNYRDRNNINDIGLAKMDGPSVNFSVNLLPLCLSNADLNGKYKCQISSSINGTVSGWGPLEIDDPEDMFLAVEEMMLIDADVCKENGKFGFADGMFCAKSTSEMGEFGGDYGAPFMIQKESRSYLIGIYSWGERAAGTGKYDYFTNVTSHVDWIKSVIR